MRNLLLTASFALCAGCFGKTADQHPVAAAPAEHRDEPEHEQLPSQLRLTPEVASAAGVRTQAVEEAVLPQTIELSGEIGADPDRVADVTAPVAGRLLEVDAAEGQRVKKGSRIAALASPDLARARAALISAQARAEAGDLNAERVARLQEKGLASGQELQDTKAQARSLAAEARAAQESLQAFGTSVSSGGARLDLLAPIDGFVVARDGVRGQSVEEGHRVAQIVALDRAFFLARVFEKDLAKVRPGASVEVRLNAYPELVLVGRVVTIGRAIDPAARTVVARIAIESAGDELSAGLFGKARIETLGSQGGVAHPVVPVGAVTKLLEKSVVFVQHADGDYEVHPVDLGASAGGRQEVLSGLRAGEKVVVEGVFTLKSMVLRGTFGEED